MPLSAQKKKRRMKGSHHYMMIFLIKNKYLSVIESKNVYVGNKSLTSILTVINPYPCDLFVSWSLINLMSSICKYRKIKTIINSTDIVVVLYKFCFYCQSS